MKYIISHDIGTTGVKSCLFDEQLGLAGYLYNRTDTWYNEDGRVLQSPEQWWQIISSSMKKLVSKADIDPSDVVCVCVDGHMNGCIPIGADGSLLKEKTPLWADFSAVIQAAFIEEKIDRNEFYSITGCGMGTPIYPAAKILKLKEEEPDLYDKAASFLGTKDYINLKLTGKCVTDYSEGSNYGLMDIRQKEWSKRILDAINVNEYKLPELLGSGSVIGNLTSEAAEQCGLKETTVVVQGAGDVVSASVGAGSNSDDVYYINLGSATWLSKSYTVDSFLSDEHYRPFVLRHAVDGLLASQLVSFGGGICKQWIVDLLAKAVRTDEKAVQQTADIIYSRVENREIDYSRSKLMFLPYLRGGVASAPGLRGTFSGLSMEHDAYDMIDAVMTGVAYHLRSMMPFINNSEGKRSDTLRIIGGGARSGRWCQMIADICDVKILCAPELQSATARGTAVIGGVGCGIFNDFTIADSASGKWTLYVPDNAKKEACNIGYEKFKKTISALRSC